MKISIGADHAGFALKEKLRERLQAEGHEVTDHGTTSAVSTDYPDYAVAVAEDVRRHDADRGVLVCSTGVGMSIAANKVPGIRAALVLDTDAAELTRRHNDANVLALAAKYTTEEKAAELVEVFLATPFDGGRHERRLQKIVATEERVRKEGE
ncbi:MAG: ribose 5-phosphate isomerase B [Bryobacterales bacterium]|nr:ribose 5-phosphate isomerase B [Bryobacterales bacterium]